MTAKITHVALLASAAGWGVIHGQGDSAEAAIANAQLGGDERAFEAFPISQDMAGCFDADYCPTEALVTDGVADLIVPSEILYNADKIARKYIANRFDTLRASYNWIEGAANGIADLAIEQGLTSADALRPLVLSVARKKDIHPGELFREAKLKWEIEFDMATA